MKSALFCFSLLSALFVALPAHAASFEVGGWIPYWKTASGTQDVLPRLNQLTVVQPFVFTMQSDGTIVDSGSITKEPWVSFVAEARAKKVRVIPTILWSDGTAMQNVLSNTTARIALEDAITSLVVQNNFDGIDIDFEGKRPETRDYFSTFLRGLYQRMGPKWVYCTVETNSPSNDFSALAKYCDRVQIMAYDQGAGDASLDNARQGPYIPVADPAWVEKSLTAALASIPKKKIILGIPTYGYEYQLTPVVNSGYRYDLLWAFNPQYASDTALRYHLSPTRNSAGEMSVIFRPAGSPDVSAVTSVPIKSNKPVQIATTIYSQAATAGQLIAEPHILWWSDAQAVADKVAIAKKLGLRGIAIFKFDGGEDSGIWSILK